MGNVGWREDGRMDSMTPAQLQNLFAAYNTATAAEATAMR
jgi:hypothetical protein